MTDDVIHSTQYYLEYVNRATLANLQRRPLKLGSLIVLQETHLWLWKILFPWQLTLFQSPLTWFQYVSDFQLERPQTRANIFICLLDHAYEVLLANIKMECQRWPGKLLIWGRSGTQFNAMETVLLSSYCGEHLVESYCKKSKISDTNWLRYLFSSDLNNIWLSVWRHHLANLHSLKTRISLEQKEIFEKSKQHCSSHADYLFMFQNGLDRKDVIFVIVPL